MTEQVGALHGSTQPAASAIEVLSGSELFGGLPVSAYESVRDEIELRHLAAGDVLVHEGDAARELFVIARGELVVSRDSDGSIQELEVLRAGQVVGEIALLSGSIRTASVSARTPCEVVSLSAAGFAHLVEAHPERAEALSHVATDRLRATQLVAHFNTIFGVLDPDMLGLVAEVAEWRSIRAGQLLFSAGDPGDAAYLVATGRLGVYAVDAHTRVEREIGQLGRGDIVGEIALLDGQPRTASVYALRDTQLIRFTRTAYDALLERHPQVGLAIAEVALRRQRVDTTRLREGHHSFIVVPVTPSVDRTAFARELAHHLGDSARIVTSGQVDDMLGLPDACQVGDEDAGALRLSYALEELEGAHEALVYVPDDTWSPWSRRAMRWSDHVVLVADTTESSDQSPHELELWALVARQRHPDVSLVLLHPPDTDVPTGTPRWLEHRDVVSHHHVRQGDNDHLARAARLLSGRGTSVVLSGGGAKGFAHLGVLDVLDELEVTVDMIGGSSIGSIMAAATALEWDAERRRATALAAFEDVMDFTLPTTSFLKARKISRGLEKHLGGIDLTDFWIPYFCVATDLTRGAAVYLDRGDVVRAVRASVSLPAVMPPVPLEGSLLVDGAVLDNVPVAEMRRRNPTGTVIAVDVSAPGGDRAVDDYGLSVGGVGALRARRRGSGPPSLMTTIMRSTLVASAGARQQAIDDGLADLYLQLDVGGANLLDFSAGAGMIEVAADASRGPVVDWVERWRNDEEALMPEVIETGSERAPILDPDRRRRSGGTLLLTLRDFQFRSTRFGSVVVGIAVVLALLFLMTGLTEQFHREPRLTVEGFGAEAWLLPEGASGAFTSAATMPSTVVDAVSGAEAAPLVFGRHALTEDGEATDIVVVGVEMGALGTPDLASGELPAEPGQAVIDATAELGVGDVAQVGATAFEITGTTSGRSLFAGMPMLYLGVPDAQELLYRGQPQVTAVLLDGVPGEVPAGTAVLTPTEIADDATRPLERSIRSVNLIRVLLWLVAALIIGTMTYLSALERRRDVAVLKAVGASTRQLGMSIALQGVCIAVVAALLASVLQVVMVPIFPLDVTVPDRAFWQIPLIAIGVSLAAGFVGLRKAVGVDPALAFSGPGA